jgi:hypothetical protein
MILQAGEYGRPLKWVPSVVSEGSADPAEKKSFGFVLILVIFV